MEQGPIRDIQAETASGGWHLVVQLLESRTTRAYGPGATERILFLMQNEHPIAQRNTQTSQLSLSFDVADQVLGDALRTGLRRMWETFEMVGLRQTRIAAASMSPIDTLDLDELPDIDVSLFAIEFERELQKFDEI